MACRRPRPAHAGERARARNPGRRVAGQRAWAFGSLKATGIPMCTATAPTPGSTSPLAGRTVDLGQGGSLPGTGRPSRGRWPSCSRSRPLRGRAAVAEEREDDGRGAFAIERRPDPAFRLAASELTRERAPQLQVRRRAGACVPRRRAPVAASCRPVRGRSPSARADAPGRRRDPRQPQDPLARRERLDLRAEALESRRRRSRRDH